MNSDSVSARGKPMEGAGFTENSVNMRLFLLIIVEPLAGGQTKGK